MSMNELELVEDITRYNEAYRAGKPLVTDSDYDHYIEELRTLNPDHELLDIVEPESEETFGKERVRHPQPMLSTEKAYTEDEVFKFMRRVSQAAADLDMGGVTYRVTPKLDGLAGRDDGKVLVTRGDGTQGYDITRSFDRGLVPVGGRGLGVGEIVMDLAYFEEHLSEEFEHPRNFMVGLTSADDLNASALKALEDGVARFVPYSTLIAWEGTAEELENGLANIVTNVRVCDYPIDGVVIECKDEEVKKHMGATSHHHKWQIALKPKSETAETTVESISWQVGRTGKVTPVLNVSPVKVSGATIRRVTAHNAGQVQDLKIGKGSKIKISRAGEVIPKLLKVLESTAPDLPNNCPCCGTGLAWQNDFLVCGNHDNCTDQLEGRIKHFFNILGQADGFGGAAAKKIVASGTTKVSTIYRLDEKAFVSMGFGAGQAANLVSEMERSKSQPLDDWRLLAALGIHDLGRGDSRKLLKEFPLEELGSLTKEQLVKIRGFGEVTSESITAGLKEQWSTIVSLLELNFNLIRTKTAAESAAIESPIAGKKIVFTGAMQSGKRDELKANARDMGAETPSSVSKTTDYLVCGDKVGAAKTGKAEKLGVKVLSEDEYISLISGENA